MIKNEFFYKKSPVFVNILYDFNVSMFIEPIPFMSFK